MKHESNSFQEQPLAPTCATAPMRVAGAGRGEAAGEGKRGSSSQAISSSAAARARCATASRCSCFCCSLCSLQQHPPKESPPAHSPRQSFPAGLVTLRRLSRSTSPLTLLDPLSIHSADVSSNQLSDIHQLVHNKINHEHCCIEAISYSQQQWTG